MVGLEVIHEIELARKRLQAYFALPAAGCGSYDVLEHMVAPH